MEPSTPRIELIAEVVDEERQLDGSRHLEIVGADDSASLALRMVIDRDDAVSESELNLEREREFDVITFEAARAEHRNELLRVALRAAAHRLDVVQREDGDFHLTLHVDDGEAGE